MKTKLLLVLCGVIVTGCRTPTAYENKVLGLLKSQAVEPKGEYQDGWNAALKNINHHIKEKTLHKID